MLGYLIASAWCLSLVACYVLGRKDERRLRHRRRGGYVRPPASAPMRVGGTRTRGTAITARISSYSLRGDPSGGWDTLTPRLLRSRLGARGSSGSATAARGGSGQLRDSVV